MLVEVTHAKGLNGVGGTLKVDKRGEGAAFAGRALVAGRHYFNIVASSQRREAKSAEESIDHGLKARNHLYL